MRYLVRVNELSQKIRYLQNQLNVIDDSINELSRVELSIMWEGVASQKFLDKYDTYILELNMIKDNISRLLEYLTSYCDKYGIKYSNLYKKYATYDEVK